LPRISAHSRGIGYPDQQTGWRRASIEKLGSWYRLMIIGFVLVAAVHVGGQKRRLEAKTEGTGDERGG
jgi:uncharacterized membrane protein YoaT (DUF817 family)